MPRKVTLANSLGRSLPLTTNVVMSAQQVNPVPEILIAPNISYPADYLLRELNGNRKQRRIRLKELRNGKS